MNNKKGFTLVELIVSFALITAVSMAFFRTILVLQQTQLKNIAKNSYKAFTVVLNNSIQKDFLNDNIEKIISCGENCYDITYTTNGITRLSIDKENNTITYGSIKEKLPKDFKFINNIEFTSYINSYEGNDSYVALNINIKSNYEKDIQNIKYVYQYDSDNGIIELDVDGADASDVIEYLLYSSPEENGLYEPLLPDGTSTGIRYYGENPNNYVYFNCEDKDSNNVNYGEDGYDYDSSCEVWRIIGVFDVDNGKGNIEKRVKLVNTASIFQASWDSSASDINNGYGVNQWGESTYEDGTYYAGADLMQLLNGYYIGEEEEKCIYCNGLEQEICNETCTYENMIDKMMKPLTTDAISIIENSVWYTNAVKYPNDSITTSVFADTAYLEEKGISSQYVGNDFCKTNGGSSCNDTVIRTTNWEGLIGLMSMSDVLYANGWLYSLAEKPAFPWLITPNAISINAGISYFSGYFDVGYDGTGIQKIVFPSLYLKSNVTFIGNGTGTEDNPYILGINE